MKLNKTSEPKDKSPENQRLKNLFDAQITPPTKLQTQYLNLNLPQKKALLTMTAFTHRNHHTPYKAAVPSTFSPPYLP